MKIRFDQNNDIMRIKFQEGKYEISKDIDEDMVIDMTKDNKIMAIEIMNVSHRIPVKGMKEVTVGISS